MTCNLNRALAGLLVLAVIAILIQLLADPLRLNSDPRDLASCFKITVPTSVKIVQKEIPAPDHVSYWFQVSNCSESFYQQLLAHSEQIGPKEEQRNRAIWDFRNHNLDFSAAGLEASDANYVSVASFSAAMFYSPKDQQAVIFIDTY